MQKIEIVWHIHWNDDYPTETTVKVGDSYLNYFEILQLAQNDGFDTIDDFFAYFSENFKGVIIHWTDKIY